MFITQLNICAFYCEHHYGTLLVSIFCSSADYAIFGVIWENFHCIWCKSFIIILKKYAGTSSCIGTIWDEFNKQHQYKSIFNAKSALFDAHIIVGY